MADGLVQRKPGGGRGMRTICSGCASVLPGSGASLQDRFDVVFGQCGDGHERVAAEVAREQRGVVDVEVVVAIDSSVLVSGHSPDAATERVDGVGGEHFALEDVVAVIDSVGG